LRFNGLRLPHSSNRNLSAASAFGRRTDAFFSKFENSLQDDPPGGPEFQDPEAIEYVSLVVVGDLIGSGEAQERGIVGETPNLAARLQGIAEPNTAVIAEATRKLLGNLFELQDLGAKDLKGIAGSVHAWAALRPSSAEGRFEALHASGLTALVGREEELELLLMAHRIRECMRSGGLGPLGGSGQIVEADETYYGNIDKAKIRTETTRGRPFTKSGKTGPANKRPIVALVERGGNVRTFHVPVADQVTVEKIVAENIAHESRLHTDESRLYFNAADTFTAHETAKRSTYTATWPNSLQTPGLRRHAGVVESASGRGSRSVHCHRSAPRVRRPSNLKGNPEMNKSTRS
jgi:ISXO2-like transposase domain